MSIIKNRDFLTKDESFWYAVQAANTTIQTIINEGHSNVQGKQSQQSTQGDGNKIKRIPKFIENKG